MTRKHGKIICQKMRIDFRIDDKRMEGEILKIKYELKFVLQKLITSENCLKNSKEYNSAVCMHETKGSERNGRDFGEQMESVKCRKREASVKSERHSHQA